MLSKRARRPERWTDGRVAPLNLIVVVAFALVAVLLLARTALNADGIGDDVGGSITPQFSAVDGDLGRLPVLDRTGMLAEDIATRMLPIAESLGAAADATADAARDAEAVRDAAKPIREQVGRTDASATAIRASLQELAPVVLQILAGTGDIGGSLGRADTVTDRAATTLTRLLAQLRGIVVDARTVRARVAEIEASMRRTERHGASAAGAKVLDCPATSSACVP